MLDSLYRSSSLTTAARELARYKLDWWVYRNLGGTDGRMVRAGGYTFCYGKGNENHQFGTGFLTPQNSISSKQHSLLVVGCDL
jgi:hypothetical protein